MEKGLPSMVFFVKYNGSKLQKNLLAEKTQHLLTYVVVQNCNNILNCPENQVKKCKICIK